MAFEHQVTVRFNEVDRAGIAYFAQAFVYCHVAFEELLTAIFGGVDPIFSGAEWGMPLVHAEADYRRPLRLDDRLTVRLEVERLGEGSVTFAFAIVGADGDERARVRHVHAFVNMAGFTPRAAPPELVAGLERLGLV